MRMPSYRRMCKLWWILRGKGNPNFVKNLDGGNSNLPYRALIYQLTDPHVCPGIVKSYSHTNLWESVEMVRILNSYGFVVDVIDRAEDNYLPTNSYDLFIGLGAGRSGKHFSKYAQALPKAIKILLAAGPEPILSNRLVQEQYDRFNRRHNSNVPAMRLTSGINFSAFLESTDYILAIGEQGQFCSESYKETGKPILTFLPGTNQDIKFIPEWLETRSLNNFLCFAGHGFICKGVDLLVEAFLEMPDLNLFICGPDSEKEFFNILGDKIKSASNIQYLGFVSVNGPKFSELLGVCAFVIFASSSEGCGTSVATAMRGGLVPILTREVGINIGDFGYLLSGRREDMIKQIKSKSYIASSSTEDEYRKRVYGTIKDSLKYTQASFTTTFSQAILRVLEDRIYS